MNGSIAANGSIVNDGNMNVNGTKTENAGLEMVQITKKLESEYFSGGTIDRHTGNYVLNETNVNVNSPLDIGGKAMLGGNINLNAGIMAQGDISITGGVINANNSVICSKMGNITIDTGSTNLNGLVYAPQGRVEITSQNLNLNNIIVIADRITLNGSNVNANYNSSMGRFIGASPYSEAVIPDEPEDMADENGNGLPDYYEDYDNWAELADSDGDGLPDIIEEYIKTNKEAADSDGDGLDDFYEVFVTYTDPTLVDSDNNGVSDADEDFDKDGLTNIQERDWKTSPYNDDTDEDGLKDGEEVNTYKTDPLKNDTDDDRLEDGDEIYFGTDPLNPDTDGNGILDGDEKRPQTFLYENGESIIENVSISMKATGNLQKTSDIDNIMDKDILCSEIVGLVGEPFSIETDSKFDKAVITFKVDKSKLDDTEFADLLFLWYDEENYEFVELETICDEENSTVSVETTHFSKYMIVDSKKWIAAWAAELNYSKSIGGVPKAVNYTVLAIDCSGSMSYYDQIKYISVHGISQKTCKRIEAAKGFIDNMGNKDKVAVVLFDDMVSVAAGMTDKDKVNTLDAALQKVYSAGGTSYNAAIKESMSLLSSSDIKENNVKKRIILLSDGDAYVNQGYLEEAKKKKIEIYTIGLGPASYDARLKEIAQKTGGKFYKAFTGNELVDIYAELGFGDDFDKTDTDGDGLYDVVETVGIRIQNGQIIKGCDPKKKDTDGDGLLDGEEIDPRPRHYEEKRRGNEIIHVKGYSFVMKSNPTKEDSDDDGLLDGKRQYYSCRIIAPKDSTPLSYTGERGLWKKHISVINDEENNNFATGYSDKYFGIEIKDGELKVTGKDDNWIKKWSDVVRAALTSIGSLTLSFTYDDKEIALHSDKKQWQIHFGYNDFYDKVANKVAGIKRMKLNFELKGKPYIVWAWKGNYLNLGPGAELGFYRQSVALKGIGEVTRFNHWKVGKDRFPMTLSLYKRSFDTKGNVTGYSNYFNWMTLNEQWWATGFVPNIQDFKSITADELVQISSIDFTGNPEMFDALKNSDKAKKKKKYLVFDEEVKRLWIMW